MMGGVHLRYMLLNNCRNLVNQLLLQEGDFKRMKTHRKNILLTISIISICLLTSCVYPKPCKYFNFLIDNNVMKVGQKQQVYLEYACYTEFQISYSIDDENIIKFDSETFILTALNVGESEFALRNELMNTDSVTIVFI